MRELKQTFHTFTTCLTGSRAAAPPPVIPAPPTVVIPAAELSGSAPLPAPVSAINQQTRERLSSVSKRRKVSVDSDAYITCEEDSDLSAGYEYQRDYRRKMARRSSVKSSDKNTDSSASNPQTSGHKSQPKRDTVWGTGKVNSNSRFKAVTPRVPQIFLSKCNHSAQEDDVKE